MALSDVTQPTTTWSGGESLRVANHSFEDGIGSFPDDWDNFGVIGRVWSWASNNAQDGTRYLRIDSATNSGSIVISAVACAIEAGKTYTIRYWYKLSNGGSSNNIVFRLAKERSISATLPQVVPAGSYNTTKATEWAEKTHTFTSDFTGLVYVYVEGGLGGVNQYACIDNISLTRAGTTFTDVVPVTTDWSDA